MQSIIRFTRKKGWKLLIALLIMLFSILMILPFVWMLSASFKMQRDVMRIPIKWIPDYFYIENYRRVLHIGPSATKDYHFFLAYWNSIKLAVINTLTTMLTAALAGYAFAKIKFWGSKVLFIVYLAQMMIPPQVTLIPRFVMFAEMGLTKSHWPLILSKCVAISAIFLLRQAYSSVPDELRESAKVDGAGEYRTWFQIILPMVKPTLGACATVAFLDSWNNYLDPLVFLANWRLHTIPIALNQFVSEEVTQYGLVMAACCMTVIPVFIVFLCGQKFFIKGLTVGAVKG